jgi:type I restriction enzyme S subunit
MACLPFGHLEVVIDRNSLGVVDQYSQYRDQVIKLSGKPVSTDSLLNPNYSGVSGVLHSAVDPMNRPAIMGEDFWFLHNPKAAQPIDLSVFSWCRQYVLDGDTLRTIQPNLNKNG